MTLSAYTVHLAQRSGELLPMMVAADASLREALRYFGNKAATELLIQATKQEGEQSYEDYLSASPGPAQSWVAAGAIDRVFGAIVEAARQAKLMQAEQAALPAAEENPS